MKRALITGVTGQDGRYLAELLLRRGYAVTGSTRREHVPPGLLDVPEGSAMRVVPCDLRDADRLRELVASTAPDEVYHLAAPTSVRDSWADPEGTDDAIAGSTARLLDAVRTQAPRARVFVAGSSEIYDPAAESPQRETTPVAPKSPYGRAKARALALVREQRERHGLHACVGILFNHESPRRGAGFVTRRIAEGVARIVAGADAVLPLGRLDARRDWGWAPDYVDAMHRMLRPGHADDYVIATGDTHTVEELAALAFARAGLDWRTHVVVDPALVRPPEPGIRAGDASRARAELGWSPTVTFEELVHRMVDAALSRREASP